MSIATMRLWRMCTTPRTGESEAWSEVEADISLEVPHVRRPLVVSGDTSEPVKGTGTDMTRKSIQETERRNYTRYTWECVSALLLTDREDVRVKVRGCVSEAARPASRTDGAGRQ